MTFGVHIFGPHDRNVSACNGLCSASCGIFPPADRIVKLYMIVIFVELNNLTQFIIPVEGSLNWTWSCGPNFFPVLFKAKNGLSSAWNLT